MKTPAIAVAALAVTACSSTPTQKLADTAIQTIQVAHQTLPKECQTEQNKLLTKTAQQQVQAVVEHCNTEITSVKHQRNTWIATTAALAIIIAMYFFGKIKA